MEFVLAVLVLAVALVALAYPLYRAQARPAYLNAATLDDLLAERDGVYATLRDLEQDRELGKLDASDYDALHDRYMSRAADILQELDLLRGEGGAKEASAEIEREVAALRAGTEKAQAREQKDTASGTAKAKSQTSELRCANCGRPYNAGDKFCARCGKAL